MQLVHLNSLSSHVKQGFLHGRQIIISLAIIHLLYHLSIYIYYDFKLVKSLLDKNCTSHMNHMIYNILDIVSIYSARYLLIVNVYL